MSRGVHRFDCHIWQEQMRTLQENPLSVREDTVSGTLSDKSIIVTGAGQEIGFGIAHDIADGGAHVRAADSIRSL
jgi:hypothetical protein